MSACNALVLRRLAARSKKVGRCYFQRAETYGQIHNILNGALTEGVVITDDQRAYNP